MEVADIFHDNIAIEIASGITAGRLIIMAATAFI